MATKVKPSRLQISGTPQAGRVPVYVDADNFKRGAGGGDSVKVFTLQGLQDYTTAEESRAEYLQGNPVIVMFGGTAYQYTSGTLLYSDIPSAFSNGTISEKMLVYTMSGDNVTNIESSIMTFTNPDLTPYQLKSNLVTNLSGADDTHYPSAKAVADAISSAGGGDVLGPNSSTDGDIALFDGNTGKIIKDSGKSLTSLESDISANTTAISTINGKIPSAATSSNQLADKDYVNDSINSVTAYYITKDSQGNQFATYAELAAATTFYSGGVVRVPTRNDYTIVLDDETHNDEVTRYIYNNGWEYQYTINESPLTQAQLNAINSGITAAKVSQYDGYASSKADDNAVVHLAGAETVTGAKTFNNTLVVNTDNNNGLVVQSASDGGYLYVNRGTGDNAVKMAIKSGRSGGTFGTDTNHQFQFRTNNVMRMQIDSGSDGGKVQLATTSIPATGDDSNYVPSTSWVQGELAYKQDELQSGVNIRTINGTSILGSGDIATPTGNTQTFVMASSSDTAAAQEAYDWYAAGNNPILSLNGRSYSLYSFSASLMVFYGGTSNGNGASYSTLTENLINVELSSGTVTSVNSGTSSTTTLSPTANYGTPFTPTQNGHPATKKYVDDSLTTKQDTLVSGTNIKTINGESVLGSGDLAIDGLPDQTGQSGKYLTTDGTTASWGSPNWIGTEDEYEALGSGKLTDGVYHWIYIDDEA